MQGEMMGEDRGWLRERSGPFSISIRAKVLSSTVLVLLLLTTVSIFFYPLQQQRVALDKMRTQTRLLAEMVSLGVGIGLELNQLQAVQAAVGWAKEDPNLAYVLVADSDGEVFASYNPESIEVDMARALTEPGSIREDGGLLRLTVPIEYQDNALGTLLLATSMEATLAEIADFRITALGVAGLALILGSGLALFFADRITDPLRRLRDAADRVAVGDLDVAIDRGGGDEVGRLGQAFGVMVDRVRAMVTELEDKGQSLALARDRALVASRTKSDFLAAMSHEIRTPMNGIMGMLELLRGTALTRRQELYVDTASGSATVLLSLLNDILDLSKLEAGRIDIEAIEFDLRATSEGVTRLLAERARKKGLALSFFQHEAIPDRVIGDPVRIRQILHNLGDNAIKFTSEGSVGIRVVPAQEENPSGVVRFEILDTGIGIDEEAKARLFRPFTQADSSTTRRFGGTGLGLSIVRRLAAAMDGEVGVEGQPGAGSLFWVEIPLDTPSECGLPYPDLFEGVRVLTVGVPDGEGELLEHHLGRRGAILTRSSGAETEGDFDLVIQGAVPSGGERSRWPGAQVATLCHFEVEAVEGHRIDLPLQRDDLLETLGRALGRLEAPEEEARATEANKGPTRARKAKLLLAEDHEVNRLLAVEILEGIGFQVDVVENGREALEARFERDYDVILMDCQMPEMDGLEATGRIRAEEAAQELTAVPIVALTANAIAGDRERCIAAGMDDYLSKPFTTEDLEAVVERWLGRLEGQTEIPGRETQQPPGESPEPFDLERLGKMLGGDEQKMRKYLRMFVDVTDTMLPEMEAALGAADSEQLRKLAHKLKGSAAMVGATHLAEHALTMERQASAGELDSITDRYPEFADDFDVARTVALAF